MQKTLNKLYTIIFFLQYVNGNFIRQRAMGGTSVVYHYILYRENLQAMYYSMNDRKRKSFSCFFPPSSVSFFITAKRVARENCMYNVERKNRWNS